MAAQELLIALVWGLVFQLPWIAGLILAGLLFWHWRSLGSSLVALALGLLIVWWLLATLIPPAVIFPLVEPGPDLFTVGIAFSFLDNVLQTALVVMLAAGFFRLMRGLAESVEN